MKGSLHENVEATANFPQGDDVRDAREIAKDGWLTEAMDAATSGDAARLDRLSDTLFSVCNRCGEWVAQMAECVRTGQPYTRELDALARALDRLVDETPTREDYYDGR